VLVLALLRGYKLLISPYFAGSCRFLPSCSEYARDAVLRYGALRGGWLAMKRLARCHPLGSNGFDPVPAASVGPTLRSGVEPELKLGPTGGKWLR
jgi:putative membrane protein insertion efficiency factor